MAEKSCLIGIQETKITSTSERLIRHMWGDDYYGFSRVDAIGYSGGILTIWDENVFFNTMTMGE